MAKAAAKKAQAAGAERRPQLAGKEASFGTVKVTVLPPAERMSLRAPAPSVAALSNALQMILPEAPRTSAHSKGRTVLWLGPDEWLVIDESGKDPLSEVAKVNILHSAVGISHRNVAFLVSGKGAEDTLAAGCPQDLSLAAFPVGAATRTLLGKVEIVLLRTGNDAFRVECWRSFSDYAFSFLTEAARDAAQG